MTPSRLMVDTHPPQADAAAEREPLRTRRPHRNRGALERALRQERGARRRNFAGWLLTVLIAAVACAALVVWIAQQRARPLSPTATTPVTIPLPPADEMNDPLPAGAAVHALPAR